MHLFSLPLQRERPGLCGPYTLAAVLRFHGYRTSIRKLTRLCQATRAQGTAPEHLAAAARACGFRAQETSWADFRDLAAALRRGLPPIVLWFSETEGHYSVVAGLNRASIALADPQWGKVRRMSRSTFRRIWFDFSTSGPERSSRLYARWMLVVAPRRKRSS